MTEAEIAEGERAEAYVNGLIRGPAVPSRQRTPEEAIQIGRRRMGHMRRFLERLGNPHEGLRVVHVGGTSGKGSVAAKIAAGLTAGGYRSGLHCTPYLQTPLEKFLCDGRVARPGELAELVAWVRPAVQAMARDDPAGRPTYGMVWVALTFEYFRRRAVDFLVLEVGAGGRFDLTNVGTPVLAVITTVGLDHLRSLGGTLENIAWHKAGIYKPDVPALVGTVPAEARRVLVEQAAWVGAPLTEAREISGGSVDFRQANTALARAALTCLGALGYGGLDDRAQAATGTAELPGRFERMPDPEHVLLDGAHNPDKARALARVLRGYAEGRPVVLVAGVVGYRSAGDVLAPLLPLAETWIATEPRVLGKPPAPAASVGIDGAALGRPPAAEVADPRAALRLALRMCSPGGLVIVAGSLYLVGNVRERWYPTEAVVRQRTLWPEQPEGLRHT